MKILVIRFSSIGDIVLTTPVLRALKQQLDNPEIHFVTKQQFVSIPESNPHVDKVFAMNKSIDELIGMLKDEEYDCIVDLHNNIRTLALKKKLSRPAYTFQKLNWKKWVLVKLKRNKLPDSHVVDRYFAAVEGLGVKNDGKPGEFYIRAVNELEVESFDLVPKSYISVAIGAQFATKRMPAEILIKIISQISLPVVLIGGETDVDLANSIEKGLEKKVYNACGKFNLEQSASIVRQSSKLLTNDTGMMHIASCFQVPIVSVWGNTVPAFGMYPYYPKQREMYTIHEVENLNCRPCSKIGFAKCPKGHFKCMMDQNTVEIIQSINS